MREYVHRKVDNYKARERGKILDKTPDGDVRVELLDGLVLELDPVEVITTWE